jgi:hypothetical protein
MKYELTLQLENVFGGDGYIRFEDMKQPKLSRKKVRSKKSEDIGVAVDRSMQEDLYEIKKTDIHTFKQENGSYYLRLGGVHGKFWGILREIGYLMRETGKEFSSKAEVDRLLSKVIITPSMVKLEDVKNVHIEQLPQILNTIGRSMNFPYFDVIESCKASVSVEFPDMFQSKVEKLLEGVQNLACLNKRRAIIKILKKVEA